MMGSLYLLLLIAALCSMVSAFQHNPVIGSTGVRLVSTRKFLFGNPEPPKNNGKKDGGLLGGLGNMGNMMENIKKAQETAQKIQKELSETIIIGQDPTGEATSTFTGLGSPISIKLSDALLTKGAEAASLAATQAMVDGHTKSQQALMDKMKDVYPGGIPGA